MDPSHPDSFRLERWKIVGNVVSVFITVGLGTLGVTLVNSSIQHRQLEQQKAEHAAQLKLQEQKDLAERQKAEIQYLGEYLTYALDKDIANRIRFAEYFSTLTVSPELQGRWTTYWETQKALQLAEIDKKRECDEAIRKGDVSATAECGVQLALLASQTASLAPAASASWAPNDVTETACVEPYLSEIVRAITIPHSAFPDGVEWRLERMGVAVGAQPVDRSPGAPLTASRIWSRYREALTRASAEYRVPVELLLATIATQSGGNPTARRSEPQIGDETVGLTQLLTGTARTVMNDKSISAEWLLTPENAIRAGAAYIAAQRSRTNFDPPLVAAGYDAGSVRRDQSPANRWKVRTFGNNVDRFVTWFNDAVVVLRDEDEPPPNSFVACLP